MSQIQTLSCNNTLYTYHQPSYYYNLANELISEFKIINNSKEIKNLIRSILYCTKSSYLLLLDIQEKFSEYKNYTLVTFPHPMVHLPHEKVSGPFHRDQLGKNSITVWTPLSDADDQLHILKWSHFGITSRVSLFFEKKGWTPFKTSLVSKRGNLYTFNQYLVHSGAENTSDKLRVGMTIRLLDHFLEHATTVPFDYNSIIRQKNLFIFDDSLYRKLYYEAFKLREILENEAKVKLSSSKKFDQYLHDIFSQILPKTPNSASLRFLAIYFYWTAIEMQNIEMKRVYSLLCKFLNVERTNGLVF